MGLNSDPGISGATVGTRSVAAAVDAMSPLASGALALSLMLVFFGLSGALFLDETTGFWMTPVQAAGSVLTISMATAFLIGASRYAKRETHVTLDKLIKSGTLTLASVAPLRM